MAGIGISIVLSFWNREDMTTRQVLFPVREGIETNSVTVDVAI